MTYLNDVEDGGGTRGSIIRNTYTIVNGLIIKWKRKNSLIILSGIKIFIENVIDFPWFDSYS